MSKDLGQPSSNRILSENAAEGTSLWQMRSTRAEAVRPEPETWINGYTSVTSVTIGDPIDFHVGVGRPERYTITIYRVGYYDGTGARRMVSSQPLEGLPQPAPATDAVTGLVSCDWSVGWTLNVPADWISGLYLAEFSTMSDRSVDVRRLSSHTPFVVRDDNRPTELCVVIPFASFQAHNMWPQDGVTGKSLIHGYRDGEISDRDRAVKVSFDRPYDGDGLPSLIDLDQHAISWAEAQGYDLAYVTDVDVHAGRVDLTNFAGVIFSGQGEYTSVEMRTALAEAVSGGTSMAFLSAKNMHWHTRLEPSADGRADRTVVCYYSTPDPETRPGMATLKWRTRDPGPGKAEQTMLGVQFRAPVVAARPLVVTNEDHWFWLGTGARDGYGFPDVVASEADGYDRRYGLPDGMRHTLLATSPYQAAGGAEQVQNTSVCEAPDGTLIFAAGTSGWTQALHHGDEPDNRIRAATAKVVARMLAPRGEPLAPAAAEDELVGISAGTPTATENRALGSRMWRVGTQNSRATDLENPQIQGYASATSVTVGSAIDFHVSVTDESTFTVSIYRIGHYGRAGARHMLDSPTLAGTPQPALRYDEETGRTECDWTSSWRLAVPDGWMSGLYLAAFTSAGGHRSLTAFVVRDDASPASMCAVLPFLTYQAANRWPLDTIHGRSLGHGYVEGTGTNATYKTRAFEVSFDRPYTHTGLPAQAYVDIDVIAWLERCGYDLTYVSNVDLHDGTVDPSRFSGLVFVGQDEYWTRPMREAVTRATHRGTSLAFLGAATSNWHARLEGAADGRADRIIACYKTSPDSRADDPDATARWRSVRPGPGSPEQAFVGVQLLGTTAEPADLIVANPDHWAWAGTGVAVGTAIDGLVKGQVDAVHSGAAVSAGHATVLAESPFTLAGKGSIEVQNTSICELESGAVVFAAGTASWTLGLVRDSHLDARVCLAMRNVLDRMAGAAQSAETPPRRSLVEAVQAAERPTSPITVENHKPGSKGWRIRVNRTTAVDDIKRQISGYASATSVALGESIDFHVSVNPAGPFTVALYRIGHYHGDGARLVATSPRLDGTTRPDPSTDPDTRAITCDWSASWTVAVPADWTSGLYYAVFTSEQGFQSVAPFVIRDPSQRDNLCVVMPFTTYQAYNQWPIDRATGRDLYNGYIPGSSSLHHDHRSYVVSFDRPYMRQGQPSRIEYDLAFIRWAESAGFDLTYASSIDLHAGRIDPTQYAGLIFPGHDEYWSEQMRANATSALRHGTSLAFLEANNIYWHVRIGDAPDGRPHRNVVCFKGTPDPSPGPAGTTVRWRSGEPGPSMPEQLLLGIQYNGIVKRPSPLIVQEPDHWFWAGTGVEKGEAIEDIVGGEADGHHPQLGSPESTVMLAQSPYELSAGGRAVQNTCVYETAEGALVFTSGSNDWPGALGLGGHFEKRIERATSNLLDRMQRPRLAARLPQIAHLGPGWDTESGPLRDAWRKVRRLIGAR